MAAMRSGHSFYLRADRTVRSGLGAHTGNESMDRVYVVIDRCGKTSAAGIAVDGVNRSGRLNSGDLGALASLRYRLPVGRGCDALARGGGPRVY
jgi:3-oxoacyl-[acyl-carrier-protein] synthase III